MDLFGGFLDWPPLSFSLLAFVRIGDLLEALEKRERDHWPDKRSLTLPLCTQIRLSELLMSWGSCVPCGRKQR